MNKISAVLIVRNEEKNIERCLKSICWVDEIIVIDQSSTDKTVEIARKYTDKIYITENKLICNPDREFGISKTLNNWVLLIEADEVVDENLKDDILKVVNEDKYDIFFIPVKTFFIGKWIKTCGWWPSYIPRLFRKGTIKYQSAIHTNGEFLSNRFYYLKNPLLHYSYNSLNDWIDKFKRYTTVIAYEYYQKNMKINFKNMIREIILRPVYFFILKYFVLKGFKDGWRGLFISLSSAFTVIMAYFKLIEIYEKKINFTDKIL
jgi:glycosyltransferase involved in cell wall biosynthesis